jgi:putative zinc finger/helix-turn-helix YgiT family protein
MENMKKECPICGVMALIEKSGEYRFNPPANIPGGAIIIPNSKWEECSACGETLLSSELLEKLDEQRYAHLGLLTPVEIKVIRENAGLTQSQIADKLGIGEKTYTRWENGKSLQNKSSDNLIRLFAMDPSSLERIESQRTSGVQFLGGLDYRKCIISGDFQWDEKVLTKQNPAATTRERKPCPRAA